MTDDSFCEPRQMVQKQVDGPVIVDVCVGTEADVHRVYVLANLEMTDDVHLQNERGAPVNNEINIHSKSFLIKSLSNLS